MYFYIITVGVVACLWGQTTWLNPQDGTMLQRALQKIVGGNALLLAEQAHSHPHYFQLIGLSVTVSDTLDGLSNRFLSSVFFTLGTENTSGFSARKKGLGHSLVSILHKLVIHSLSLSCVSLSVCVWEQIWRNGTPPKWVLISTWQTLDLSTEWLCDSSNGESEKWGTKRKGKK